MASCSTVPQLDEDECKEYVKQKQSKSLLAKYDIPITHLDYGYIGKCENAREMEKIVMILRSGEEGCYPDLLKKAEERLCVLKPESKVLRVDTPVLQGSSLDPRSREEILNGILEWCGDIKGIETELQTSDTKPAATIKAHHGMPEIRNSTTFMTDSGERRTDRSKRIASCDYNAWDKYDPDTELLKMELEEEKNREAADRERTRAEKELYKKRKQEEVVQGLTPPEKRQLAEHQRILGNESYRSGDYKVALVHYTNSLQIMPTFAVYNNRAAAYLKLKRYEEASCDCDEALMIEGDNIKALLRKAEALQALGNHDKAMEYYQHAIKIDPNNTVAQKGAYECNKFRKPPNKTVRMRIDEDDLKPSPKIVELSEQTGNPKPRNRTCLVPIPSTSNFNGPTVLEITVPEDVPMSKVDTSLIEYPKKRSLTQNPKTEEMDVESTETEIDKVNRQLLESFAKITDKKEDMPEFHTNQEGEADQTDVETTETYIDKVNKQLLDAFSKVSGIEVKMPDLKAFMNRSDGENKEKNSPKKKLGSPKANAQRLPLQEKDIRAQRKKDKKARRQAKAAPSDPFQFRQQGVGSSGDASIEVAAKYKNATANKTIWPRENEEQRSAEDREIEERLRQNYTVVQVDFNVNQLSNNQAFLDFLQSQNPTRTPESDMAPETTPDDIPDEMPEMISGVLSENVTPFEFLRSWEAIKNDGDYMLRANLLKQIDPTSLHNVIGNKLDGNMFSGILECLKRHFINTDERQNAECLANFMDAMCNLPRFSLVAMFKDQTDDDNLRKIIAHIEKADVKLKSDLAKYLK